MHSVFYFGFWHKQVGEEFVLFFSWCKNVTEIKGRKPQELFGLVLLCIFTEACLGLEDVFFTGASAQHICVKNNFAMPKKKPKRLKG